MKCHIFFEYILAKKPARLSVPKHFHSRMAKLCWIFLFTCQKKIQLSTLSEKNFHLVEAEKMDEILRVQ